MNSEILNNDIIYQFNENYKLIERCINLIPRIASFISIETIHNNIYIKYVRVDKQLYVYSFYIL